MQTLLSCFFQTTSLPRLADRNYYEQRNKQWKSRYLLLCKFTISTKHYQIDMINSIFPEKICQEPADIGKIRCDK